MICIIHNIRSPVILWIRKHGYGNGRYHAASEAIMTIVCKRRTAQSPSISAPATCTGLIGRRFGYRNRRPYQHQQPKASPRTGCSRGAGHSRGDREQTAEKGTRRRWEGAGAVVHKQTQKWSVLGIFQQPSQQPLPDSLLSKPFRRGVDES